MRATCCWQSMFVIGFNTPRLLSLRTYSQCTNTYVYVDRERIPFTWKREYPLSSNLHSFVCPFFFLFQYFHSLDTLSIHIEQMKNTKQTVSFRLHLYTQLSAHHLPLAVFVSICFRAAMIAYTTHQCTLDIRLGLKPHDQQECFEYIQYRYCTDKMVIRDKCWKPRSRYERKKTISKYFR